MALRLAEVFLPEKSDALLEALKREFKIIDSYYASSDSGGELKLLIEAETAEPLFDFLEKRCGHMPGFRIIVVAVEAVIPRLKDDEATQKSKTKISTRIGYKRIYREELYEDIKSIASGSRTFYLMVFLASCVAAIGLLRGNVAIIIGAMVLAPLLGPNMGMAFAATLGDAKLAKKSLLTNVSGSALALLIAVCIGWFATVDLDHPQIVSRIDVSYADVVLASASGAAGALSFTAGVSASLIGVMVAVALLPPLMVFGLLLGGSFYSESINAFLILATNIVCLNISAVVMFLIQGIRPNSWWEAERAKKQTRIAIAVWMFLLILLMLLIRFNSD
ncbi:MAG: TIGR00341 family protein [Desulfobacterales bacterium]|jgi:uncharacterized hydrophobic protein (TIGR00341 family)